MAEEPGVAVAEDLGVLEEGQAAVAVPAEVGRRFKGEDRWARWNKNWANWSGA